MPEKRVTSPTMVRRGSTLIDSKSNHFTAWNLLLRTRMHLKSGRPTFHSSTSTQGLEPEVCCLKNTNWTGS